MDNAGPKPGARVRVLHCGDPYTPRPPGTEGTVAFVDDVGTVHVDWDDGRKLGLVPGEDEWVVLSTVDPA